MRCGVSVMVRALIAALIGGLAARGQGPQMGEAAPEISLARWINVEKGKEPGLERLKGRVVMLEFWGTWCAPCVRAMPQVQELHERYRERGLVVLAISYEADAVLERFVKEKGYTMAVGSDPAKAVVEAYGIRSWPSTFVIGKDGAVAYAGDPYDVEPAIEKALGLESDPAALLTAWLESLRGSDAGAQRLALERLREKAVPAFDLKGWAAAQGGAAMDGVPKTDPSKALDRCAGAWKSAAGERQAALDALASGDPEAFDLAGWCRQAFARRYPLTVKELRQLLASARHAEVVDALLHRRPPAGAAASAAQDKAFKAYAAAQAPEARSCAKKAIMIREWVFSGRQPKDNDGFWQELSVSGMALSEDRKRVEGVLIEGTSVTRERVASYIEEKLGAAIVLEAVAGGREPPLRALSSLLAEEAAKILKPLARRYD